MAGPLPVTSRGNRYFLLAVDHFSKYVVAKAVPTATAHDAITFWTEEVVARFGAPERLLTDNGSNFVAREFKGTVEGLGTAKIEATPYNPQGDGVAERHIGTLKGRLRRALEATDAEWDEALPWAVLAMNSTPSGATVPAPYVVMHGHFARLGPGPPDRWEGPEPGEPLLRAAARRAAATVREACRTLLAKVRRPRPRERVAGPAVAVGDAVLVWDPTCAPRGRWVGPREVVETKGPAVVVVSDFGGGHREELNRRRVARYRWAPGSGEVALAPSRKGASAGEDVLQ